GAVTMLWHPELGFPWPGSRAEWLGLSAGFFFAVGNVLVRKLETMSDVSKSMAIWAGVMIVSLFYLGSSKLGAARAFELGWENAALVAGIALAIVLMSLALQYGLSRMPANRAIVVLLFELVVAAIAAAYLAHESLRPQDWVGGALIVAATVVSGVREKLVSDTTFRRPPESRV
ncbi:MAG: DMT family transporter, partial [Usitatibacter sp.]